MEEEFGIHKTNKYNYFCLLLLQYIESDEIHTTSNVPSKGFTKKDLTIINSFECFTRIIPKAWRNIPECLVQAFLTTVKDFKNLSTNLTIIDVN